jgi:endo-alpha-1,4-polygalactosaminidase (GH114 family)
MTEEQVSKISDLIDEYLKDVTDTTNLISGISDVFEDAYDSLVAENERLDKLAKWNLEQASMLAEDYKKTKAENQKLREALEKLRESFCLVSCDHCNRFDEITSILTKAKNV